jgi:molybdopterin-guanine dinucleotide biosynthesis protein A
MSTWSAAILAGGRGRRLDGRIKALVEVGGRPIVVRQREMLATLDVVPFLVAPDPAPFDGIGLEVVPDAVRAGALGALYTALRAAPTDRVLVLAGDMPFVTAPFVGWLLDQLGTHDAVAPRAAGRWHPLCAVYDRRVAPQLLERIERHAWRVVEALEALDVRAVTAADIAPFDRHGRLLVNVNTPEDHRHAERHATT